MCFPAGSAESECREARTSLVFRFHGQGLQSCSAEEHSSAALQVSEAPTPTDSSSPNRTTEIMIAGSVALTSISQVLKIERSAPRKFRALSYRLIT